MTYSYFPRILLLLVWCAFAFRSTAQVQLVFTVNQPPPLVADAGGDKSISKKEKVTLGGSETASGGKAGYSYLWSPAKGLDKAGVANPLASPDSTITYTVNVTDANGCR